ncbi:MAG: type IV pilus assembly protein PilM [Verrucomicrobiota bacterium]|nr:pilus assembly protein PilM [Limisphaera sp.]MDW8381403.1 type IV pilus assembly protein PilM [Verrucomicrobiota bacterium]
MRTGRSFLAVDFGAGTLKLAEFESSEAGGLRLKQYGFRSLGLQGSQESTREQVSLKALQEILAEKQIKAKDLNVCAPGFHVFSKFVKLPPVDTGKIAQIIQYEAQQNVPFPLQEVVWDYQILGTSAAGELEVLLVAIKSEIVEGLFRIAETAGLNLILTDVAPAALCNAFRYNYADVEECCMLLDIGAKTSNVLFFEKGKVFARSINLGANAITQDFAQESKLRWEQAEKLKIAEGFVSLGGAYEEPENPHQAAIAKISRQFMTRLHIQVNQTIQFYRGQQGGSAPQRLFLSGGASIMPYTAQFFAEKLNLPVEYFNPLRSVEIDPSINLEELAKVAHTMGELVGLGLRNVAQCPVELNLMPPSTLRWQSFNQKKPYFLASAYSLVVVVAAVGFLFTRLARVMEEDLKTVSHDVQPLQIREQQFKRAYAELRRLQDQAAQLTAWMEQRYYWADFMTELRRVLIEVENATKNRLGADAGVWVERFLTANLSARYSGTAEPGVEADAGAQQTQPAAGAGWDPEIRAIYEKRYGIRFPGGSAAPVNPEAPPATAEPENPEMPATGMADATTSTAQTTNTNEIATVTLYCRAVDLSRVSPSANTELAIAVLRELQQSPMVNPEGTQFEGTIQPDEQTGTYTFGINVKLRKPLRIF